MHDDAFPYELPEQRRTVAYIEIALERYARVELHRSATHRKRTNFRRRSDERVGARIPTWLQSHVRQAKAGMVEGVGGIGADLQVDSISNRE